MPVRNYFSFFPLVFKITALVHLQFTGVDFINFYILTVVNFFVVVLETALKGCVCRRLDKRRRL